jgi:hypothetical protein
MVGRGNELAVVTQARASGTGGVVVHAPAGVGKSRLGREALPEAECGGMYTRAATRACSDRPGAWRADPSEDALRVARWVLDAGEPIPSATLLDAAHAASLSGDPDLGADLILRSILGV